MPAVRLPLKQYIAECNRRRHDDLVVRGATQYHAGKLDALGCWWDKREKVWLAPDAAAAQTIRQWRGITVGTPGPRVPDERQFDYYRGWAAADLPRNIANELVAVLDPEDDRELYLAVVARAAGDVYRPVIKPKIEPEPDPSRIEAARQRAEADAAKRAQAQQEQTEIEKQKAEVRRWRARIEKAPVEALDRLLETVRQKIGQPVPDGMLRDRAARTAKRYTQEMIQEYLQWKRDTTEEYREAQEQNYADIETQTETVGTSGRPEVPLLPQAGDTAHGPRGTEAAMHAESRSRSHPGEIERRIKCTSQPRPLLLELQFLKKASVVPMGHHSTETRPERLTGSSGYPRKSGLPLAATRQTEPCSDEDRNGVGLLARPRTTPVHGTGLRLTDPAASGQTIRSAGGAGARTGTGRGSGEGRDRRLGYDPGGGVVPPG